MNEVQLFRNGQEKGMCSTHTPTAESRKRTHRMKKPENPCTPDCVKRDVGCKSYCPKWVAYTAEKAVYDTLVQKNRSAFNDIKAFQWVCCNRAIKRRKGI